jgi:hypothetical protein
MYGQYDKSSTFKNKVIREPFACFTKEMRILFDRSGHNKDTHVSEAFLLISNLGEVVL